MMRNAKQRGFTLLELLVVMVIISGYENFVSRFDNADGGEISWLGKVDAGSLKIKVASTIVAISSIHLLQVFLNLEKFTDNQLTWFTVIHIAFVISALLLAWKVAQTMMELASGIASEVARIVTELRAAGHQLPLACTRKTFPGTRSLMVKAVLSGGGVMHRLGLSDSLLLFPEHRIFVDADMDDMVGRLRRAQPEKRLVVEVTTLEEALTLAASGAEVLQLERFSPDAVRQCKTTLHASHLHPLLAVAGGVNASNAVAYAEAGADILVSSAPYHAQPKDVEVRFSRDL